ncbi:hypothetical protein HYU06_00680 [Candidatus Woesearchaeota archaeon]|nr:hypothetical protein [Candidatus Woesearchaeota archaeon]
MVELGLAFKNTSAGTFNSMLRYWEMRYEIKNLTKDEAAVKSDDAIVRKSIERHNVEAAQAAIKKLDTDAQLAFTAVHKLVQNDFLSLKVLGRVILEAEGVLHDQVKELKEAEKNKLLSPQEVRQQLALLAKDESDIGHLSTARIFDLLNRARLAVNGLMHLIQGEMDSAFFVKTRFFADGRWVNYFVMRYEAAQLRRSITKAHSREGALKKHANAINKLIKFKKGGKSEAEEFGAEEKDMHIFVALLKDAFVDVYKVFVRSLLMFEKMIKIIKREEFDVKKWVSQYEIPASMGEIDKTAKEKLLGYAKATLININRDINQLDSLRSQIGKAAV